MARRGASETEPGPKRHKAGQVTTDTGAGRATEATDVVEGSGQAGGPAKKKKKKSKKRSGRKAGMSYSQRRNERG